jgi:transcription-repair coupling factor (superfamily II helicase)
VPGKFLEQQQFRFPAFQEAIQQRESLLLEELWNSPKALLIALAHRLTKKNLIIITSGTHEYHLFHDLPYFSENAPLEFPAWETLPSEDILPSADIVGERYQILRHIGEQKSSVILIATLQACLQRLLPPDTLKKMHLIFKVGEHVSFQEVPDRLAAMGYHRKSIASDKGDFAVRGGIIDLFPASAPEPYRIEFFENEIVSIRKYDPIGQISVGKVNEIVVTPGEELELVSKQNQLSTIFDYLKGDTILVFDDLLALEDKAIALKSMTGYSSKLFLSIEEFLEHVSPLQKIYFTSSPLEELSEVRILEKSGPLYAEGAPPHEIEFHFFNRALKAKRWRHPFIPILPAFCPPEIPLDQFSADDFIRRILGMPLTLHFLCSSETEEKNLQERIASIETEKIANILFEKNYLSDGFFLKDPHYALIPLTEFTHRFRIRRQKQRSYYHTLPVEMLALTPGEAIVHMNNGIGKFLGIEKRPNHLGVETEFLLVEYAQGAKLYVPIEQANLVSKYIGATEEVPKFHTLGSSQWKKARERTEVAILGYAQDLLKLQAERAIKPGFSYPPDTDLVVRFEEEFPYQETPDQLDAIQKIRGDMLSSKLMDRLVCGDVGYGKTEVAMRAAFKAVVDGGKQVAVLVPTTVLALQHYETFIARMANFPLRIEHLSRFRTPKEIKKTLENVAAGSVDIVIGTLRVISKDVSFKNLGLVIIDEEQRFGVKAKEHLKTLKVDVDCLTLSATPIPRTLYMSLVGARDMSVINTPPEDRLPIQTFVCQSNEDVIKNALIRELARDGQAYIIHNRVETIFQFADRIRKLVPSARIVVGHGQMSADELDRVFHAFKQGNADILIATSIIENGIDIPNANTILVDRADRFGLADLYQIRGRVGRWNKKAYCYFLVPNTRELSEISRKRLSALTQSSGHGGGMKVAMHDLELRGAGNILGTEQSGHVSAIGFHLYCKLLKKAILALQKKDTPILYSETKVEFPFDARLPEDYINEVSLRMEIYQRLGDCETFEEIDHLMQEIRDRFGPPPTQVHWLHKLTRIRLFAARNRFSLLKITKLMLLAEQDHGKKNKISQKIVIRFPKNPEELETIVMEALKKHFPLTGK